MVRIHICTIVCVTVFNQPNTYLVFSDVTHVHLLRVVIDRMRLRSHRSFQIIW